MRVGCPGQYPTQESQSGLSDKYISDKIVVVQGDITKLKMDVIVNAANPSLLGGGGVDGAIHKAAGNGLRKECELLGGCRVGEAKLTKGYQLPSRYVIHTVGPKGEDKEKLRQCYMSCMKLARVNKLRNIAFPCISTGSYGYPSHKAADVAIKAVCDWLKQDRNAQLIDNVTFCVFSDSDKALYEEKKSQYFSNVKNTRDEPQKQMSQHADVKEISADKGTTMLIPITVRGITVDAVVDTASQVTLMNQEMAKMLGLPVTTGKQVKIRGIGEDIVHGYELKHLKMKIGANTYSWDILIASIKDKLILGLDFLKSVRAVIDLDENLIVINKCVIPATMKKNQIGEFTVSKVTLDAQIKIPPKSRMIVPCSTTIENTSGAYTVEPIQNIAGVWIPSVQVLGGDKVPIQIDNFSNQSVTMNAGTLVGVALESDVL